MTWAEFQTKSEENLITATFLFLREIFFFLQRYIYLLERQSYIEREGEKERVLLCVGSLPKWPQLEPSEARS